MRDPGRGFERPAPEFRCPICGEENACAPVASGTFETPCWCAAADFPAELLDRLDVADRGRSCLCPRCAAADTRPGGSRLGVKRRWPRPNEQPVDGASVDGDEGSVRDS